MFGHIKLHIAIKLADLTVRYLSFARPHSAVIFLLHVNVVTIENNYHFTLGLSCFSIRRHKVSKKQPCENITVAYYFCEELIPYRTSVRGRVVTLGQFKELLTKKGNYRYKLVEPLTFHSCPFQERCRRATSSTIDS